MRRPLVGSESMVAKAIKPLLILALAIAALFAAPAVASAAPAGGVTAGEVSTAGYESTQHSVDGINAVYTCRYASLPPFQVAQFTCTVRFGSMQVILNCQDGRQVFGPILQAVGTYNFSISCAPTAFSTFSVREFS
ncbi:hypothetical protein [Kibdelosporangium aridum]|uniref:Uncharacterized protein n=1 Tax=Kibdelosporangium aridum TaxID=2030 RepID=A0A1Y5Y3G3_KIBAR|nr:hypothetical protein [Kibdelosporangium aridum]SMD22638.1 hypothetical protein SAMN05661093_07546 [Kibdelosporangium aridum]